MKNILLLLFFSFFTLNIFAQDWKLVHPFSEYNNYLDGYFEDENNMFVVGYKGKILHSQNGGQDWELLPLFTESQLNFIKVIPNTNGQQLLIGASDAIYKSSNSGVDWDLKTSGLVIDDIIDLVVINQNLMYAAAREDQFLKSTDGGENWVLSDAETNSFFWELSFLNENEGFGLTFNGQVYHTSNGGTTWDSLTNIPSTTGRTIYFSDTNTGYASGFSNQLYKTSDGGLSWTEHSTTGYPSQAYELQQITNGDWYTRSNNGSEIYHSIDGGITWNYSTPVSGNSARFRSIDVFDDGKIFLVGENQTVLKTTDWGNSWIDFFDAPKNNLSFVKFKNENIGIAGGNSTSFLRTVDGGNTWLIIGQTISKAFDIETDSNGDWHSALGYSGIWKSTDDGETWVQKYDTEGAVLGLSKSPNGNLFGVSNIGGKAFFRSSDNGETWTESPLTTSWTITEVVFFSDMKGYIVAKQGLLVTTDGGNTWVEDASVSNNNINSVFFLNENVGWVSSVNFLYKTTDSGTTWEQQNTTGRQGTFFLDENVGFSVGGSFDNGQIYKTEDGGTSWVSDYSAPYFVRTIAGIGNNNNVVAVGNGGQIIIGIEEDPNAVSSPRVINDLRISPNPGNEFVVLDHNFNEGILLIYNIQGQLVFQKNINQEVQPTIFTDLFASGNYFFRVIGKDAQWVGKWVKE